MDDLELQYSPSSRVGGSAAPFVADYQVRSAAAAARLGAAVSTLPGGSLMVAHDPSAPLLVFIHGGYWQALSAAESLYLAPGAVARGWSFAALEYTLAPACSLGEMVTECREALAVLATRLSPSRVVLVGHSAGGHLAAMVSIVTPAPLPVARTVLVSGVFDLRPLVHTSVNEPLGLDDASAACSSPALLPVASLHDVIVAWGDNETDAFKAQSRAYAAHLAAAGARVCVHECAQRHQSDIVDALVYPTTPLGRLTIGASS